MSGSRLGLAWRLLRAEGVRSLRDRLADRRAERRRAARFELRGSLGPDEAQVPVVTLLGTPPASRLGGVQTQLLARLEAFEALGRPYALLYPEARETFRLEIWTPARRSALRVPAPALPARPTLRDPGFAEVFLRALQLVGASALHVEHLGELPIAAGLAARDAGCRLLLSVHDFGFFCPRAHLLEEPAGRFCDYAKDADRCASCLAASWRLDAAFQERRREQASELLVSAQVLAFASDFLRDRYLELFPGLDQRTAVVLEPAVAARTADGVVRRRRPRADAHLDANRRRRPLHVAFAGAVDRHKGSRELERLIETVRAEAGPDAVRWTIFGGGEEQTLRRLRRAPEVRVRGYYRRGSLPELLRRERVDLVVLLSIVPEAFGLTLGEAALAGVPVLAFDLGATGRRIRASGGGEVVRVDEGIGGIARSLLRLAVHPQRLAELAGRQAAVSPPGPEENALAALRLYAGCIMPTVAVK